jgi:hypothetical protein
MPGRPGHDKAWVPPDAVKVVEEELARIPAAKVVSPKVVATLAVSALLDAGWALTSPSPREKAAIAEHDAGLYDDIKKTMGET